MLINGIPVEINLLILGYLKFRDLINIYYDVEFSSLPEDKKLRHEIKTIINSKWKRRDYWESWCISKIYQEGDLNMLKWAVENNVVFSFSDISSVASYCGYVHILSWMKTTGIPMNIDLVEMACIGNSVESIEFLIKNGYKLDLGENIALCESRGSNEVLELLRKINDLNKN